MSVKNAYCAICKKGSTFLMILVIKNFDFQALPLYRKTKFNNMKNIFI